MTESVAPVTDDDLHAFVDGQLDGNRLPALLAWLQARPEDAARVAQWQTQRVQLRRAARALDLGETPRALADVVLDFRHDASGRGPAVRPVVETLVADEWLAARPSW